MVYGLWFKVNSLRSFTFFAKLSFSLVELKAVPLPHQARQAYHAAIALNPLGEEGLDFGAAAVAGQNVHWKFCSFLHDALHAVAHLAGGGGHTEAEFGVTFGYVASSRENSSKLGFPLDFRNSVLKERVGPGGTEAAAVVAHFIDLD